MLEVKKVVNAKYRAITGYRYISWFLTSMIYLMDSSAITLKYCIAVVVSLLVITISINSLYLKSESRVAVARVNIAESLVIAILMISTGGLDSPFIWYAINPIFITCAFFKTVYCFVNLVFYLIVASVTSLLLFNPQGLALPDLITEKCYIILVFVLIVAAIRILFTMIQHLDDQAKAFHKQKEELLGMNLKLEQANASAKNSMEHIMSLYRIIEVFAARENARDILKHLVKLANDILQTKYAFIWVAPFGEDPDSMVTGSVFEPNEDCLKEHITSWFTTNEADALNPARQVIGFQGVHYLLVSLKSVSRFYGYFGIKLVDKNEPDLYQELIKFLADIITMVLERNHFEKISSQLMILEEQNRIGNELHDNVSQLLFSIVYGIHALNSNWPKMNRENIEQQLNVLEQTAKNVSTELRTSIYGLSTRKRGERVFEESIQKYLCDFSSLNDIKVLFDFQGDEELLSYPLKQAMFRIIREGCGNAIWHGWCSELKLHIQVRIDMCELMIQDNGHGFDVEKFLKDKTSKGLGLHNMQILAQTFNGTFDLRSEITIGTTLIIRFPLNIGSLHFFKEERGVVA
ncbi:histidine kinase [Dehalobacter sp. DCM]|uniref:sensor histidine kinase n=1 Tax=Dehalobacter sp. DCM TaxID=2907827 RepID=UPI00308217C4|nr:histidine kinase [Dehalobacter sp. DCM]